MLRQTSMFFLLITVALTTGITQAKTQPLQLLQYQDQSSSVHFEPARLNDQPGIAVVFTGTDDLHYYAKKETAAGGYNLTITANAEGLTFSDAIFPQWTTFYDISQQIDVEVYVGDFKVFLPLTSHTATGTKTAEVTIAGIACTSKICLAPFTNSLKTDIDLAKINSWPALTLPAAQAHDTNGSSVVVEGASFTTPVALILAVLVGLMFNIMPCVLPVIPLIVTRLLAQSKEGKSRSITLGFAFCGGILLFFAALATLSILVNVIGHTQMQWGDQFRNPVFIIAMSLLMIVLGLFMFDVFTIGIPSSVTSKSGSGKGVLGSVSMGFLAALLSTPCSFGILAGVFAWAQTQTLGLSTLAIMLMGVGMAIPYAILVSFPSLLAKVPKPGTWMEHVRKAMGFILLVIAVKLIGSLPKERIIDLLYYSVILSFAVWMWGGWVSFSTPAKKKWTVRILALLIAVYSGFSLLPERVKLIDWQHYDAAVIEQVKQTGTPVLIKFTADWCTTCSIVDKRVFKKYDVAKLLEQKGVAVFKGDTTAKDTVATIDLAKKYKEPGVPVTLVFMPDGKKHTLRGLIGKKDLTEIIDQLPDAPKQP